MMYTTRDIKELFIDMYNYEILRENGTLELQGVSFLADKPSIFGTPNEEYILAEIAWYLTNDRKVQKLFDIYGKTVKIWDDVKNDIGEVNSNYGWCIYSKHRGHQYYKVLETLKRDPTSRQAIMIYQHPDMHDIAGKDFTCTNAVQYFINRDTINGDRLDAVVQMRSNDIVYGYNNDYAWQKYVLDRLACDLNVKPGLITWQVGSLHMYERHYHLIESYINENI